MMMKVFSLVALLCLASGISVRADCSPACDSKSTCVGEQCLCNEGYAALSTDPSSCINVDECASRSAGCDPVNGFCVDYDPPVKYQCGCVPGFTCENPPSCSSCVPDLTHACNINNGGCAASETCTPLANNRTACTAIQRMLDDSSPTNAPFAACATVNQPGSIKCNVETTFCEEVDNVPTCLCLPGFMAIGGGGCVDIDECKSMDTNNCTEGRAICVNMPGSVRCQCETGYGDFPGTIRGTDCRTPEEIELILNTGAIYDVVTGLSGLTVSDFATGSAAQASLAQYYADRFSVNVTDVEFSNITSVSSRRLSSEGRELQTVNTISFAVRFRVRYNQRITQSNVEAAADIAATFIDRIFTEISNFFLDIGTPESIFTAGYLAGVRDTFIANEVDVDDIDDVTQTRPNELTFTTDAVSLTEVTIQQAIDLGEVDNPTSNLFIQFFQSQGFSGTPTAAPSGTRRFLEAAEEEDFFGDFATDLEQGTA